MIGARYFNWAVLSGFSDTVSLVLGYVGCCSILYLYSYRCEPH